MERFVDGVVYIKVAELHPGGCQGCVADNGSIRATPLCRELVSGGEPGACNGNIWAAKPVTPGPMPPPVPPVEVARERRQADPNGLDQHSPGAKVDAGKLRAGLVLGGFSRALQAVAAVGTFGANKYTDNGWMSVPNGQARYTDALFRHLLTEAAGEALDPESNLHHAAHAAWNALARLDLMIREQEVHLA